MGCEDSTEVQSGRRNRAGSAINWRPFVFMSSTAMNAFLLVSLLPFFAIILAIKGMVSGIAPGDGRVLSKQATTIIGFSTIGASTAVIAMAFVYFVVRVRIL